MKGTWHSGHKPGNDLVSLYSKAGGHSEAEVEGVTSDVDSWP